MHGATRRMTKRSVLTVIPASRAFPVIHQESQALVITALTPADVGGFNFITDRIPQQRPAETEELAAMAVMRLAPTKMELMAAMAETVAMLPLQQSRTPTMLQTSLLARTRRQPVVTVAMVETVAPEMAMGAQEMGRRRWRRRIQRTQA